jgi:ATP-binding cassette, subfamily F, member 3
MESYRAELLGEKSETNSARRPASDDHLAPIPELKLTPQEARRLAAERRAQFAPLKKKVAYAELQMTRLTATIAKVDETLADSALYTKDPARAQQLTLERGQLAKSLADAEEAWLAASETYETAVSETETVA